MLEWPDGFGLSLQFFSAVALLLAGPALPAKLRGGITALIFGAACAHYVWFTPFGATQAGTFSYDQASLTFVICFLGFLFFSESLMRLRSNQLRLEGPALKVCLGFLGSALLLANNLAVIVIALPVFLFLALIGPSASEKGQPAGSGLSAVTWSALLLCLLCAGSGLFVSGGGIMRLDSLVFSSIAKNGVFQSGWSLIFSSLTVLVLFYPCTFLIEDSCDADDWNLAAVFRVAPSIVFTGLLYKWCRIEVGLPSAEFMQLLSVVMSAVLFLIVVFGRSLLLVLHAFALIPMTLLFWSLTDAKAAPLALPVLFVFAVGVSRLIFLFEQSGAKPSGTVKTLHEALRAASFGFRLEFFVLGLSIMPLGTFLGLNFFIHLPVEASICGASLTLAVVLFLGRVLEMNQSREGVEVGLTKAESAIGVITLAALIVLGIYPTPLYNYINYLSHHP